MENYQGLLATTLVGLVYEKGVVIAADSRADDDGTGKPKNIEKLTRRVYCAYAGDDSEYQALRSCITHADADMGISAVLVKLQEQAAHSISIFFQMELLLTDGKKVYSLTTKREPLKTTLQCSNADIHYLGSGAFGAENITTGTKVGKLLKVKDAVELARQAIMGGIISDPNSEGGFHIMVIRNNGLAEKMPTTALSGLDKNFRGRWMDFLFQRSAWISHVKESNSTKRSQLRHHVQNLLFKKPQEGEEESVHKKQGFYIVQTLAKLSNDVSRDRQFNLNMMCTDADLLAEIISTFHQRDDGFFRDTHEDTVAAYHNTRMVGFKEWAERNREALTGQISLRLVTEWIEFNSVLQADKEFEDYHTDKSMKEKCDIVEERLKKQQSEVAKAIRTFIRDAEETAYLKIVEDLFDNWKKVTKQ